MRPRRSVSAARAASATCVRSPKRWLALRSPALYRDEGWDLPKRRLHVAFDLRAYRRGHAIEGEPCHIVGGGPVPVPLVRAVVEVLGDWRPKVDAIVFGTGFHVTDIPVADRITGPALDFALVVTQRRLLADTALEAEGEDARTWIAFAQAFAGNSTATDPARRQR